MVSRPLEGLRVLDLTRFVAGSQTTALLAAFGADVVKLEVPPEGDPYRAQGTVRLGEESVLFLSPELWEAESRARFPLRARHGGGRSPPRVIAVRRRERPAGEPCSVRARLGIGPRAVPVDRVRIHLGLRRRRARRGPRRIRPDPAGRERRDEHHRQRGVGPGEGRRAGARRRRGACVRVRPSGRPRRARADRDRDARVVFAPGVRACGARNVAANTFVSGEIPGLLGTHSPKFSPYGGFRTRDGWIVLAGAGSDELWVRLCEALDARHLLEDPRFTDNGLRVRNRDALTGALEEILTREPSTHWLELLGAEGVPAAEVKDVRQVFESEQTEALGAVQRLRHPTAGEYDVVGAPLRLDLEPLPYPSPAPRLGEHTRGVLVELGLRGSSRSQRSSRRGSRSRERRTQTRGAADDTARRVPSPTGERSCAGGPRPLVVGGGRHRRRPHRRDGNVWAQRPARAADRSWSFARTWTPFSAMTSRTSWSRGVTGSSARASATTPSASPPSRLAGRSLAGGDLPVWLLATVGEEGLGNLRGSACGARGRARACRRVRRRRGELPWPRVVRRRRIGSLAGACTWARRARVGGRRHA